MSVIFTNDNNVEVKLINNDNNQVFKIDNTDVIVNNNKFFKIRDNHEVFLRKICTYLINNNFINGNVIDLGAWIGDNTIPWALNLKKYFIYAIDPSSSNIDYIKKTAEYNNIQNIKLFQLAISDKIEEIGTDDHINHCTFSKKGGKLKIKSYTLDHLYKHKFIENISFIHLDVEGFEFNVVKGAENLIKENKPIITFEQHLEIDNYKELSKHIYNLDYNVYLIDEILPNCRTDCRNFIAFPKNLSINLNDIYKHTKKDLLLPINLD